MPISNPIRPKHKAFQPLEERAQILYDATKSQRCSALGFRTVQTFYSGWAMVENGKWAGLKPNAKWVCVHNGINPELTIRAHKKSMTIETFIQLDASTTLHFDSGSRICIKGVKGKVKLQYATLAVAQNWLDIIQQAITHGIWLKKLMITKQIGEGSFSKVMLCKNKISSEGFALKIVQGSIQENTEVRILLKLCHVGRLMPVVDVLKVFENQNRTCIALPLYTGNTLFSVVRAKKALSEFCTAKHMKAIAESLRDIHAAGVVHCDLKLENIMFNKSGQLRLIDFGGAIDMNTVSEEDRIGLVATPGYIAPERLDGKAALPSSDIFSVGIIMYLCLTGKHPFPVKGSSIRMNSTRQVDTKLTSKRWNNISEEAKDLTRRMLDSNPDTRITAHEILHHPWITDMPLLL